MKIDLTYNLLYKSIENVLSPTEKNVETATVKYHVVVQQTGAGSWAHLKDNKEVGAHGRNQNEAVGAMVTAYPNIFSVIVEK